MPRVIEFNTPRNAAAMTFDETERRRALARQLGNAQPINDIRSNEQGFAHVLGKGLEAWNLHKADTADRTRNQALAAALGGMAPEGVAPELWQSMVGADPSGMASVAFDAASDRAKAQREAQAKALERQQAREDWQWQQDYSRKNAAPTADWSKLDDGTLYNQRTGETRTVAPVGDPQTFRFAGNSVEAQSYNGLIDRKLLTPEQAMQLGAGKTVTGPNGEIIFMTPQGVFSSPADGGPATPLGGSGGNITLTGPKVTLDERKAMTFADRMAQSGEILDNLENAGLGTWDQLFKDNDWIPDKAENFMVSEDFQRFDQARRDFINAQLRRESGATIQPEEFDNANKQYFPMPGDTADVVAQKRANRKTVRDGMIRDAGPTYVAPLVGVPEEAIELLKSDPSLAPQFDQKYGAGASKRALGAF